MAVLVSISNLRISFRLDRQATVPAVRGVSFDIPEDGTVALVGESGSGKSASAMSILRLRVSQSLCRHFQHQLLLRQHVLHFQRRNAKLSERDSDHRDGIECRVVSASD